MWNKPWGIGEGIWTGTGLVVIGVILQLCTGGVEWNRFAWPLNLYVLVGYLLVLGLLYMLRQRLYFVRWSMSYKAAVPSLAFVAFLTLLMGLIKQAPASSSSGGIGLDRMLSFWPFVLVYLWMTSIVGWVSIRHLCSFRWRKIPFLCNHLGLFVALVSATLGSADMQRLTMNARVGQAEWRAADSEGRLVELPLAIELKEFTIDEYPPKLMLIDNASGKALPDGAPEHLLLEDDVKEGDLSGWKVRVDEKIEMAASVSGKDTVRFVEWHSMGATYAARVHVVSPDGLQVRDGWVSCGSFLFPYQALRLDSACSLVMPDREPRRFASKVMIYTQSGTKTETEIEVNRPAEVEGWKIYQLSYDETKGRWSDVSVFELVTDPWLPAVYTGIVMMMIGALCMFVTAHKYKKEEQV